MLCKCILQLILFGLFSMQGMAIAQPSSDLSLQQRVKKLAIDVDNAEAIREVKRLQHAYAHYAEFGLWNDLVDLFADNAVGHYPSGTVNGKENLRKLFLDEIGGGQVGLADGRLYPHIMLSPVVTLDADGVTAHGRWHVMAMLGTYGESATWAGGIYENEYVKDDGIWKISTVHYYPQYSGNYEDGWRNIKEETPDDVAPVPFHYDVDDAGTPTPDLQLSAIALSAADDSTPLAGQFGKLERRIQVLNDKSQVQTLQNAYGYYVDRQRWDDIADLFARNGTLEIGLRGVYVGQDSIRKALTQFGEAGLQTGELNDHLQLQTVVSISPNGMNGYARGTELQMVGENNVGGYWAQATFENTYIKEDGVWKINSMHVYPRFKTDYRKGWAEDAQAMVAASDEFSPDKPTTEIYSAYPSTYIPSFHYAHPVTGRAPNYPPPASATRSIVSKTETPLRPYPKTSTELQQRIVEAERMLAIAKAYDGAENVSNAYGYYIDEFLWRNMADLFAVDGWKELSYIGTYVGRERVYTSVSRRYESEGRRANSLAIHQKTQPVVHVADDGQSARIRTRLFQINSSISDEGSYIAGIYENQVVKENGVWKILGMDLDYTWQAGYKEGWTNVEPRSNNRFAPQEGGVADEYPPDRPLRGVTFAPYPDTADMAFHYRNPVSGREPEVLLEQ